jgi:hypothetical protein
LRGGVCHMALNHMIPNSTAVPLALHWGPRHVRSTQEGYRYLLGRFIGKYKIFCLPYL